MVFAANPVEQLEFSRQRRIVVMALIIAALNSERTDRLRSILRYALKCGSSYEGA